MVSAAPCWDFSQEGKFKLILLNRQFTRLAIWAVFFAVPFLSSHSPAEAATITTKHFLIDYAEISKPEALSFGKTADRAYEMVTEFLGAPQEHEFLRVKRIHMFIRSQFRIPRTLIFLWRGENRMEMPVHRVRDGKANLIHEISHSLAPSRNRFLAEGLSVYLEERFGNLSAFPTFGRPVRDLLCQYRMEGHFISLEALLREIQGEAEIFTRRNARTITLRMAYLEGGALVKLLMEGDRFGDSPESRKNRFFRVFHGKADFNATYGETTGVERTMIEQTCSEGKSDP